MVPSVGHGAGPTTGHSDDESRPFASIISSKTSSIVVSREPLRESFSKAWNTSRCDTLPFADRGRKGFSDGAWARTER